MKLLAVLFRTGVGVGVGIGVGIGVGVAVAPASAFPGDGGPYGGPTVKICPGYGPFPIGVPCPAPPAPPAPPTPQPLPSEPAPTPQRLPLEPPVATR